LEAPFQIVGGVVNLERLATKVFDVIRIMQKCWEVAKASMNGAQSVSAGLGLVWNSTPVPAMVPATTAPNLPRPAIARFQ
jgi:hypothetical protein